MSNESQRLCPPSEGYLELRAAAPLRAGLRVALERLKITGYAIDWREQNGRSDSIFVLRGHPATLAAIRQAMDRMLASIMPGIHTERYTRGMRLDLLA
jgi:hypothetical protein